MVMEVIALSKTIKGVDVLKDINVRLESGNIYGVVCSNGSGKTMFLRALAGLIVPTTGEIHIDDLILHKNMDFPHNMGLLIEKPSFLNYLTGFENLKLLADINKIASVETIKRFMTEYGMDPESPKKVKEYSLGMKQKLGIIQAIMEDPVLLVLDEPTSALDETTINIFRNYLNTHKDNKIIVMTSHNKADINTICTHVFTMTDGVLQETA